MMIHQCATIKNVVLHQSISNRRMINAIAARVTSKNHSLRKKLPINRNRRFIKLLEFFLTVLPTITPKNKVHEFQAVS